LAAIVRLAAMGRAAVGEETLRLGIGVEPQRLDPPEPCLGEPGDDEGFQVELVMAFEEEFSVEIPDDAAEQIQTFGDAVSFLEKAVG
jgi:acyl carrier protein